MSALISGPHTHAPISVSSVMGQVMLALVPATAYGIYLFGYPALFLVILCIVSAVVAEAFCLVLLNKPLRPFLLDGSAALTGWLIALTLPPWAPWWIAVVGCSFAIIIGKQVFGGIGQNIFNPAMLARVMLLIAFPLEMTTWVAPHPLFSLTALNLNESLQITFGSIGNLDAVSSASLLGYIKTELTLGKTIPDIVQHANYSPFTSFLGMTSGSLGETSGILLLLGGIYLLFMRIISWHIPVAMLGSLVAISTLFHFLNPERYVSADYHVLNGGAMVAAFFFATDYVTSPSTKTGKVIFGAGVGSVEYLIRTWGSFPEGVGFAILIMNALTPLIDHYVRPRIYGRTYRGKPIETPTNPK
jgi:Na+-translocating ferredoxin:NAD+ oxidoreductase subunit D